MTPRSLLNEVRKVLGASALYDKAHAELEKGTVVIYCPYSMRFMRAGQETFDRLGRLKALDGMEITHSHDDWWVIKPRNFP